MERWQEDLLGIVSDNTMSESAVFKRIEGASIALEFEYVAYGFQSPVPFTNPKFTLLNNYPRSWQERYNQARYLQIDPTVIHGRKSHKPIIWADPVFADTQFFWDEARAYGLRVGWAQSSQHDLTAGMITLARSCEPLSAKELDEKQPKMKWLVQISHLAFSRLMGCSLTSQEQSLTDREIEVLKWSADGKSAQDIADILNVSKSTVDFHIKNAVAKLQVANKTAAVVRAAVFGLLS